MSRLFALATIGLLVATTTSAASQTSGLPIPPPDTPIESANLKPTLHRPPSVGISLGDLHVRFEKSTLADIQQKIGAGIIAHRGDAGDSLTWLCYTIPYVHDTTRLWLSSGELEGNTYVSSATAELSHGAIPATSQCPDLPLRFRHIALDHALWLGMPNARFDKALGNPSHEREGWRMFNYLAPIDRGRCEQQNWLWTHSTDDQVTRIDVGQTSSC